MSSLQVFRNSEFGEIRTQVIDDEPWFCLADVCKSLDLEQTSRVKSRLNAKGVTTSKAPTKGGLQDLTFINEPNLYKTIFQSRKESAERFTDWVTTEVLPSIRKHGGYIAGQNQMNEEELMARAILFARDKIEEQKKVIAELEPKAFFADAVSSSNDSILVRELAKMMRQNGLNIGEKRLYAKLREDGFIIQKSCEPTQKAMEMGLFEIIIRTIDTGRTDRYPLELRTTKVTGKGQIYFINRYCNIKCKGA